MTALERSESAIAWELRGYWAKGTVVAVTMSERCMVRTVVGRVRRVAVTGAFAVIDGWHLPMADVLRVARATVEDKDAYRSAYDVALDQGGSYGAREDGQPADS